MGVLDSKRRECNDSAVHCFGTAYIFEKRARCLRWRTRILLFLGIAGPASVGAILGSFLLPDQYRKYVLGIAAGIALLQLIGSIWSLIAKWDDSLSYFLESKSHNYRLADHFANLAMETSLSDAEFNTNLGVLNKESELRSDLDNRQDLTDKEKRMGLRAALRQYQRPCVKCTKVPNSLKPTKCPICGNP